MQFFTSPREDLETTALNASMRAVQVYEESAGAMTFDVNEHAEWCASRVQAPWTIHVREPESKGTYLKKHTTFLVTEDANNFSVRRRFSDFAWLHSVLKARYIGLLIPSMPEKNVLKSEAFIQSRMRGLTLFLQHIVDSPYLRDDLAVTNFFTKTEDAAWDAAKKEASTMESGGEGHVRWIKRIACRTMPAAIENEIASFKRQVEQQEKILSELLLCTKRLTEKSLAHAKDTAHLLTLFNGWTVTETTSPTTDAELLLALQSTTTVVDGWSQTVRHEPGIYELILHDSLKYLHQQARDMKDMLHSRESSINAAQHAANGPNATSSSPFGVAGAASSFASRFRSTESSSADPELAQRRSKHASEMIARALLAEEMERFQTSIRVCLGTTVQQFAFAQAEVTKKAGTIWRDFVKANVQDRKALLESTTQILENVAPSDEVSSAEAY
ncbi:hypothetical protein Poli38472_003155 [Pythium oligandrum]|uniref:PX domain-containing protein n=1 Tax=Pythium oligandrum TaxID=41045 RepID=A0A8K1C6H4_PYTOL|nr:hypothetical protein Poli38472_003155 [Pythium oligandrum]|eukprot:TMW57230.1 hypothetical protein Poli38472_003155 [Pythium oligandrum]